MPDRVDGQTTFGSDRVDDCRIRVISKAGRASAICLVDTTGAEFFLWFDTTGDLRAGNQAAFEAADQNASGAVVGGQT